MPSCCSRGDSTNAEIGRFYQTISERVTAISSHLLFFTLELNRLDEAALEQKLADPALAQWRPWLRDLRVFRPHQLSDELEKLLHEKEVTGRSAWSRLFDETVAGMRVPLGGEELTVSAALNKLSDRDRSVREAAAARSARRSAGISGCSRWLPTRWRRTRRSSTRGGTIRAPAATATAPTWWRMRWSMRWSQRCAADFPRLAHRYYLMKAKWLGLPKLQHWDRNAPLPDDDDRIDPLGRCARAGADGVWRVQSGTGRCRQALLRPAMDRCDAEAGQGGRRVRASHGAIGASLSAAELSRPHARRDDAGARTGPRRASGAGGGAGLPDGGHAADAWPRPPVCSARC